MLLSTSYKNFNLVNIYQVFPNQVFKPSVLQLFLLLGLGFASPSISSTHEDVIY